MIEVKSRSLNEKLAMTHDTKYVEQQISSINAMLGGRSQHFGLMNGVSVLSPEINRPRVITRDALRQAMKNPYRNIERLQQLSSLLKISNGVYQTVLNYQSNILTNDHIILPVDIDKLSSHEKMKQSYLEIAQELEKFEIKRLLPWMYSRLFEQGELYFYLVEDSKGIIVQEIPNNLCQVTSIESNVNRFGINLGKLSESTIEYFPTEVQTAFKKFMSGSIKREDLIDRTFYELKDGVALTLERFAHKGLPFFASVFDDIMDLEDMKDLKSESAIIESIKLIHQKLPIDKDSGVVLMDFKVATGYHQATKRNLPKNAAITTNPLEIQALNLADNSNKSNQNIVQSLNNVFDSVGINNEIFNGTKSSNEAIASGIVADGLITKEAQKIVQTWLNFELSKRKKKGATWKVKFIDTSHFDKIERAKIAREDMAFGGLRAEYFATNGYSPFDWMSGLLMESILDVDSLMIPQQTSHTASGSDSEDKGRPKKGEGKSEGGNAKTPEED